MISLNSLNKIINYFNNHKYDKYIYGIQYNYTKEFAMIFDEFEKNISYDIFNEYLESYDIIHKYDKLCIMIIFIKSLIEDENKKDNMYLDLLFFESNTYSKVESSGEFYCELSEHDNIILSNKNEIEAFYSVSEDIPKDIIIKKINDSGLEKYGIKKCSSTMYIGNNKIFKHIKKSSYSKILEFNTHDIILYPFIFHHKSYIRLKNNGDYRIMNKINLIGDITSGKINKIISSKIIKDKNSVYNTYMNYVKMITNNKGYDNVYQLDIKKAYDTLNHKIFLAMLPCNEKLNSIINLFLSCSMNFKVNNNFIEIKRSRGIPIGSILSPMFYEIYIYNIIKENFGFKSYVRYVDDFRILWPLQNNINIKGYEKEQLINSFKKYGIEVNEAKSGKIDLKGKFLKYPNNIYNYEKIVSYLFGYYKKYTTYVTYFNNIYSSLNTVVENNNIKEKLSILFTKFTNQRNNQSIIDLYKKNISQDILTNEEIDKYLNEYFNDYTIIKTYDEDCYKLVHSNSLYMYLYKNNKIELLDLRFTSYLFLECNICNNYGLVNNICKKNSCITCLECNIKNYKYLNTNGCICCNIPTKLFNINFKIRLFSHPFFDFIKIMFQKKQELTILYNKIYSKHELENISNITRYIEHNEDILIQSNNELKSILDKYVKVENDLKKYIINNLIGDKISIINIKCKYCLNINNTSNDKLFKCNCNNIYQCKICPYEYSKYITHECIKNIVLCPNCRIPISKECGCDHMKCQCGKDFNFKMPLFLIQFDYKNINKNHINGFNNLYNYEKILYIILNYNIPSFNKLFNLILTF